MKAIATFFVVSWGLLIGLVAAGAVVMAGHPQTLLEHLAWGAAGVFVTLFTCLGFGRFIEDKRMGTTLGVIASVALLLMFALRVLGILPST